MTQSTAVSSWRSPVLYKYKKPNKSGCCHAPGVSAARPACSAASEPFAEEGVEQERTTVVGASHDAIVAEQAFECVLQRAAGDPVFVRDPAARGGLAVSPAAPPSGARSDEDHLAAR